MNLASLIIVSNQGAVDTSRTTTHDQGMRLRLHKNITTGKANRTTIPEFTQFSSLLRKLILTHAFLYLGYNILKLNHCTLNQCISECDMF